MTQSAVAPVLRVACAQTPVVEGDLDANATRAAALASAAGEAGARLLVLGEAFLTGYSEAVFAGDLPTEAQSIEALAEVARISAATGCAVLVPTTLRRGFGGTLSLILVRPDADPAVVYDKQHLVGHEVDHLVAGATGASLLIDGWNLGLSLCYDASFPEHARAAAAAGAHAYVNANAFFPGGSARQEIYCRARALDNGQYVVSASLTGSCGGIDFVGGSAIHDPEGRRVARMGTESGMVVADLEMELVRATRAAHTMHADHRRSLGGRRTVV